MDQYSEAFCEKTNAPLWRLIPVRKEPKFVSVKVMLRTFTAAEPALKEALQDTDKTPGEGNRKAQCPRKMRCGEIAKRPNNEKVMHTELLLKIKLDEMGEVCKHEARLVVCINDAENYQEEPLSPVAHYFVINLLLSLCIQRG